MIAAIHARKSTEQAGVAEAQKSAAREIGPAGDRASRKRWTVVDDHLYVDDGISCAEFANRPGFAQLMNANAVRGLVCPQVMERATGIEPVSEAWEASVLPL